MYQGLLEAITRAGRRSFRDPCSGSRTAARPRRLVCESLERRLLLAAGDLDPTFGDGGLVISSGPDEVSRMWNDAVVLSDGRIVAVGGEYSLKIARYNANGSLDPSFGDNGLVVAPSTDALPLRNGLPPTMLDFSNEV